MAIGFWLFDDHF